MSRIGSFGEHFHDPPSQLDLVSDCPPPAPQPQQVSPTRNHNCTNTGIRQRDVKPFLFHFSCCRVAAQLQMPKRVLDGTVSSWRVRCPRCATLSEIPVVD